MKNHDFMKKSYQLLVVSLLCVSAKGMAEVDTSWLLIDDFESASNTLSSDWHIRDVQNETKPFVKSPQIALIKQEQTSQNQYYLKKPAANGVVGNRKALSYIKLPNTLNVGDTATFYTRIMVESFPNNHSFGLSNQHPADIDKLAYNAFEPMLRVTDKTESDGTQNSGALMVIKEALNGKAKYQDIQNPLNGKAADPLQEGKWYEVWYVVDNRLKENGGQTYSVYIRGGEFSQQQKVYDNAEFRMKREAELVYFVTIANTGPLKQPYGNGGLAYDDIYMTTGIELSAPVD